MFRAMNGLFGERFNLFISSGLNIFGPNLLLLSPNLRRAGFLSDKTQPIEVETVVS